MNGNGSILARFLLPDSIAVFGSMQEDWFFGAGVIIKDLLKWNYRGSIYPVHPSARRVYGCKVFKSMKDIDEIPALAVIVTSYRHVPKILAECGAKGVKAAVIVSDGFGEAGPEGIAREQELVNIARSCGMRIIGPNTVGIFNAADRISTVPYEKGYEYNEKGGLSIITQTGMYGPQAMAWNEYDSGINKVIDLGNMCDVDETDCLEYLVNDDETAIVSLYMEHTRRPEAFRKAAGNLSLKKPLLCLKPGKSSGAAKAMASHTGSMAGNDSLYMSLFRQTGVIRVEEYEDLRDCATPFLRYPLPKGNRLGIITFSGAVGIQSIDAAEKAGLALSVLTAESRKELSSIHNTLEGHPIDIGPVSATAGTEIFTIYKHCFDVLKKDETVDCIYLNTYVSHGLKPDYYNELFQYIGSCREKPVALWSYGPSGQLVSECGKLSESFGIPFFYTTAKAIRSLGYMARYAGWIKQSTNRP
ncbi:MAG: CoA-binding protein [Syntrophales bacterium]|nr:CoA-binding protein [Syntrophales bacterium]